MQIIVSRACRGTKGRAPAEPRGSGPEEQQGNRGAGLKPTSALFPYSPIPLFPYSPTHLTSAKRFHDAQHVLVSLALRIAHGQGGLRADRIRHARVAANGAGEPGPEAQILLAGQCELVEHL